METTKLRLLKRLKSKEPGEIVEVRPMEARVLKAVGVAEDYIPPRRSTATRVMQPTVQPKEPETVVPPPISTSTETLSPSVETSSNEPYSRRDMRPEE